MANPAIQTLQDVTNLVLMIGVVTLVTISWKASRANTQREEKLNAIHDVVINTRDNHLHSLSDDVKDNHSEILKEMRESNSKVIETIRDGNDRIVTAIYSLKN